ncbi:unnamed protein product [Danaus chrysippus]|uniref:(African queen) hypothetical protein n=1 Tax=Danaus chrysippus TaxID=151541 RepID=A0A8J2VQR4_9NEOP|nr:unnamed protein product [Danaus chrysippus]
MNVYILAGVTAFFCVILHFIYKTFFGQQKCDVQNDESKSVTGAQSETASETSNNENRPSGKSKKRGTWKAGKTDFSHPWLLKNLKGHPGNVLLMDFSANGKFLAATCDGDNDTPEQTYQ